MRPRLQPLLLRDAGQRGDIHTHIGLPIPMTRRLQTNHPDGCTAKVWTSLSENERWWRERCRWARTPSAEAPRRTGGVKQGVAGAVSGRQETPASLFRMMWPT